jgi:hypothetical protein
MFALPPKADVARRHLACPLSANSDILRCSKQSPHVITLITSTPGNKNSEAPRREAGTGISIPGVPIFARSMTPG